MPIPTNDAKLRIRIDWDSDGFLNSHCDVTSYTLAFDCSYGITEPDGHIASDGVASIRLKDETGLFSPENESSPLFGRVTVNRRVWFELWDHRTKSWTLKWAGFIDRITPSAKSGSMRVVTLRANQKLLKLERPFEWSIAEDAKAGDVIKTILVGNNWIPAKFTPTARLGLTYLGDETAYLNSEIVGKVDTSLLDDGLMTFPYVGLDWEEDIDGLYKALKQLSEAERGYLFVTGTGEIMFHDMLHYSLHNYIQDTIDVGKDALSASYLYGELPIATEVRVAYSPKYIDENAILYDNTTTFGKEIKLNGDSDREIKLRFEDANGNDVRAIEMRDINAEIGTGSWEQVFDLTDDLGVLEPYYVTGQSDGENGYPGMGVVDATKGLVAETVQDPDTSNYVKATAIGFRDMFDYGITYVEVEYVLTANVDQLTNSLVGVTIFDEDDNVLATRGASFSTLTQRLVVELISPVERIYVRVVSFNDTTSSASGNAIIKSLRLRGTGVSPFEKSYLTAVGIDSNEDQTEVLQYSYEVSPESVTFQFINPLEEDLLVYMTLRGKALFEGEELEIKDASESASRKVNRVISKELSNKLWATDAQALTILYHDLNWRRKWVGFLDTFDVISSNKDGYERQLDREVGDIISISDPTFGITNRRHVIKHIKHRYDHALKTTYTLQPISGDNYAIMGAARLNQSRISGADYRPGTYLFEEE